MSSSACTILGLSVLAVLLAGYLGQKYLPPPTPKVVGIDLGTTYSCIGVYQAVTGEVHVIEDSEGHQCIPSIVAFSENEVVVGYKAMVQSANRPAATIYDAKRFIGRKMTKEELMSDAARYPFKMSLDEQHDLLFHPLTKPVNQSMNSKQAVLSMPLTPLDIGSYILRTLKKTAESNLSATVMKAVMAVPAEFNERQRNFTRKAAAKAGIEVLRIINEPTAAALAYGLDKKPNVRSVMVVDLGGGTLDVSLLHIQGGMFVTVAMAGNSHLGGQDFTEKLADYCQQLITAQYGQPLNHPEDIQSLRTSAETAKLHLTYHDSAEIDIAIKLKDHTRWKHSISVATFEKINKDIFQKVIEPIDRILESTNFAPEHIDEIVLVGGSTRIPKIRKMLRDYFGKDVNTSIEPELAVTLGVSIQAGIIGGMWPLTVSALEVTTSVKKIHLD